MAQLYENNRAIQTCRQENSYASWTDASRFFFLCMYWVSIDSKTSILPSSFILFLVFSSNDIYVFLGDDAENYSSLNISFPFDFYSYYMLSNYNSYSNRAAHSAHVFVYSIFDGRRATESSSSIPFAIFQLRSTCQRTHTGARASGDTWWRKMLTQDHISQKIIMKKSNTHETLIKGETMPAEQSLVNK